MPSPFPGMDPYLEAPSHWPGLHDLLIVLTVGKLQSELNERGYYVNPGERVWVTEPSRSIDPDVAVLRAPEILPTIPSATAVADEPVSVRNGLVRIREPYIDIHEAGTDRLITAIEFISPWNKSTRQGRMLYRLKQRQCHRQEIHLIEIDLLRRGKHIASVPPVLFKHHQPFTYLVNIERAGASVYEFYPVWIRNRLPRIVVPLKTGDPDAVLDLQAVFTQAYDMGPYRMRIDYRTPLPALADDDALWADQLLKDKGLR